MVFHFANCILDTSRHQLTLAGQPVHVEPQVFDLLVLLAENGGDLVTLETLINSIWDGLNVSDSTISARIHAARKAVGDTGKNQAVIQTIRRRGFRLVAPISTPSPSNTEFPEPDLQLHSVGYIRSADGLQIAHQKSGNGPPLIRAAHWLAHLELDWQSPVWRPFLDRLRSHNTLHRYDQRGTGLSGREFPGVGIDEFVGDLKAVADANGLEKFSIMASSQGVPVAVKFAAQYPERVHKLVLYGGYAQGRAVRNHTTDDLDQGTMLGLVRAGWGKANSPFMRSFSTLFMPDATAEQLDDFVNIQLNSATGENAVKLRCLIDRFDVADVLNQVKARTLVIHAHGDAAQPFEQGQLLASEIKNAKLVALDSTNHVPLPQTPSWMRMMDEIEKFLGAD